jgi:formimidoylglutamase
MDDPLWPRVSDWILGSAGGPTAIDLVGVPSSIASISTSNARTAPTAFRAALAGFSPFDGDRDVDLETVSIADHGDLDIDDTSMVTSQAQIREYASALDLSGLPVFIGGDNAITRPLVGVVGGDLDTIGVVTLDAHHDVRVLDDGPRNGTPIRGLIEDGLPGRNVVQIGIHSFANSKAYRRYCEEQGITVITMDDIDASSPRGVAEAASYHLGHVEGIYVDFDIDVLDRAHAPGCPGARPGGMTPRQLGAIAFELGRNRRVVAADFVEVDPDRDRDAITVQAMVHTFLSFVSGVASRGVAP